MMNNNREICRNELHNLANLLANYRDELADNLGTWHPLFELVDDALRSMELHRMDTARRVVERWFFRWQAPREQGQPRATEGRGGSNL